MKFISTQINLTRLKYLGWSYFILYLSISPNDYISKLWQLCLAGMICDHFLFIKKQFSLLMLKYFCSQSVNLGLFGLWGGNVDMQIMQVTVLHLIRYLFLKRLEWLELINKLFWLHWWHIHINCCDQVDFKAMEAQTVGYTLMGCHWECYGTCVICLDWGIRWAQCILTEGG